MQLLSCGTAALRLDDLVKAYPASCGYYVIANQLAEGAARRAASIYYLCRSWRMCKSWRAVLCAVWRILSGMDVLRPFWNLWGDRRPQSLRRFRAQ